MTGVLTSWTVRRDPRTINPVGTYELDRSTFCLLLTTQLEAKQMSETDK